MLEAELEVVSAKTWGDPLGMVEHVGRSVLESIGPEEAIQEVVKACYETLGDRLAHLQPGALRASERQFFVAGAFFVTPDRRYHMLVGNIGFPAEQRRLLVPVDGGHPGYVYATRKKLILRNTDEHPSFRQYLRTSRMGSAVFAPMIFKGEFHGQLLMAAQARNTMAEADLAILVAMANIAAVAWIAHGGPAWLSNEYPPAGGYYVEKSGLGTRE